MDLENKFDYFKLENDGHLKDEASAFVIEAMLQGKKSDVPEHLLTHVETCRECKDKIIELVTFMKNPESAGLLKQKLLKQTRIRKNWYFYRGKIAAVFVSLALVIGAYFLISHNPQILKNTILNSDSSKQEMNHLQEFSKEKFPGKKNNVPHPIASQNKKEIGKIKTNDQKIKNNHSLSYRFQVNPNLENMTGSRMRSGLFEVQSPENGCILNKNIHFSWKKDLNKPHTLKIVDNKNSVLFTYSVKGTYFDFRENLSPGLYYWKLENQNELLHVGKFIINSNRLSPN